MSLNAYLCERMTNTIDEMILTATAILLRIVSNPLGNVFQKRLTNRRNHPLLVNFLTFLILSFFCVVLAVNVDWGALPLGFWEYCIMAGIVGATGNGFLVKALQYGDLSILGPINSYKSVVGIIIGIFLLGEIPNLWGVAGMALIIYGSYFVLDTVDGHFSWKLLKRKEIQYRIFAMVLTAIEAVFIKKIILYSSTTTSFIVWCFFGAIFSFILLFVFKIHIHKEFTQIKKKDLPDYLYLVLCIGTMQYTTNYVFDHIEVGYGLALFQLSTIVSILLGYSIFKEGQIAKKLLGSVIMIIGSVMIILLK